MTNQRPMCRKSSRCLRAAVIILACVVWWRPGNGQNRLDVPTFSARAIRIYGGEQVRSPDKKTRVHLEALHARLPDSPSNFPARLIVDTDGERLTAAIGFALDAEIIWSPDSRAFSLTGSEEGANGQYRTDVFLIQAGKLVSLHLTDIIEEKFGHPVKCGWPEPPNVAAISWLAPSRQLLVAAEIIHHSSCDRFGTFRAYAVDLGQKTSVSKEYDQLQVKQLFREDLGRELLQADDNCISRSKILSRCL
jgi:hypothetical protein